MNYNGGQFFFIRVREASFRVEELKIGNLKLFMQNFSTPKFSLVISHSLCDS